MLKLKSRPQKLALKAISLAFWIGDLGFLVVPIGVYHAMKSIFVAIFSFIGDKPGHVVHFHAKNSKSAYLSDREMSLTWKAQLGNDCDWKISGQEMSL